MTDTERNEQALLDKLKALYPPKAFEEMKRAFVFAKNAHAGQFRSSKEEYFIHPCHVVSILADLGLDTATIMAAFLHDTLEDTKITDEELLAAFGDEVYGLVKGVTKLDKMQFETREQAQAENLRKMLLAMSHDIRVIIIKLADRLHNMRTLESLTEEQQLRISKETLDVYAPLAARLGIGQIKGELEDISMKYLLPKEYNELAAVLSERKAERDEFVAKVTAELSEKLTALGVNFEINGRSKHLYSIYRKMKKQGTGLEQVYDLIAIRIIVDSVKDCYGVLGAIHTMWAPLPGRFKDYIATPKPNLYQSLHTTVITKLGAPFEIQIRTKEMHRTAEYGIAAHWKYKDGFTDKDLDDKVRWIREVMEIQEQDSMSDSMSYVDLLKMDIFNDEVFVFTPKGDVVNLPTGSTIVDFAYNIHSKIGDKCVGGKVNMKMVPLSTELKTGDIVEIITNNAAKGPSRDWLRFVKTSSARSKIKQFFKRTMREENIKVGREMLEAEIKRRGYSAKELFIKEWLLTIAVRYSMNTVDDLYAAVGYGELTTGQVVVRLIDTLKKMTPQETVTPDELALAAEETEQQLSRKNISGKSADDILINGVGGLLVRTSHCCNPVPGDAIVGYISRNRGITVHRADCPNLSDLEPERMTKAEWASVIGGRFSAGLTVYAANRPALIAEITTLLSNMHIDILSFNAKVDKDNMAILNLSVELDKIETLEMLRTKLMSIRSIKGVTRN